MPVKYRKAIRKSPDSDPQQYLVYRMEAEAFGGRGYFWLTRPEIKRFAKSVCKNYRVPQVKIKFDDLGRWAAEWCSDGKITFGKKKTSQDLVTLIHELAHHIHHHLVNSEGHEDHGPQFMACYMSVLDTARVIPVVGMRAICESYRVKYNDPGVKNSLGALKKALRG